MPLSEVPRTGEEVNFRAPIIHEPVGIHVPIETGPPYTPFECHLIGITGFNAAAVVDDGQLFVLSRSPLHEVPIPGQPDINNLVLSVVNPDDLNIQSSVVIWEPEKEAEISTVPRICNLEDLRVGKDYVGFTAVVQHPEFIMEGKISGPTRYIPYPGFIHLLTTHADKVPFGNMSEAIWVESLGAGKNFTPIGKVFEGKETFLFRAEGEANNHTLQVVVLNEETNEVKVVDQLVFPKSPWSQWRMGTTAGLFWLDEKYALLPIHGINKEHSPTNDEGLYKYSLGVALIEKDESGHLKVVKVADKPLIVPEHLDHLVGERFPGYRRIVYSCGVWLEEIPTGQVFHFLVNKGDKGTILVKIPIAEVMTNILSNEPQVILTH